MTGGMSPDVVFFLVFLYSLSLFPDCPNMNSFYHMGSHHYDVLSHKVFGIHRSKGIQTKTSKSMIQNVFLLLNNCLVFWVIALIKYHIYHFMFIY